MVRPSGRLPSDRVSPWGSLVTGRPAEPKARATRSFIIISSVFQTPSVVDPALGTQLLELLGNC